MNAELHTAQWCEELVNNYSSQLIGGTYGPPLSDPTSWVKVDYAVVLRLVAYVVLFVGGLLGNLSVLLAIYLNRSMRNTTNYYVANLAVADALICIFCVPYHAFTVLTKPNHFVLGAFMCKFSPVAQVTCLTSSAFTLSAISCDRLVAILFPLRARVTKQRTSVVMTTIWLLSAVVSVPFLFTRVLYRFPYENFLQTECREVWPEVYHYDASLPVPCYDTKPLRLAYHAVITVVLFFLPLFIMVTAYSLILWRLSRTEVPGEQCAANVDVHNRAKRKVNKMVFIVLVALFACGTPLQFCLLYESIRIPSIDGPLPYWFFQFIWYAYFLAFANSFLNPFIYGGFNKDYLKGFCKLFRCGNKGNAYSGSGSNFFLKSLQSVGTKLTSVKCRTVKMFSKSVSDEPPREEELAKPTAV